MLLFLILPFIGTISCDRLFARSESLNLTGAGQPAASLGYCAFLCQADDTCALAEFHEAEQKCIMSTSTGPELTGRPDPDDTSIVYGPSAMPLGDGMLIVAQDSSSNAPKPRHCASVLASAPGAPSGVYFIWPDGVTRSRVWCDMDTDGGGWTMVYSYRALFLELENNANAVEPFPTWPVVDPNLVARSVVPPSDLQQYGALNFSLWADVGEEFMIKSNINNWIACEPGTGSLSGWVAGQIFCRMIKSITIICPDLPTENFFLSLYDRGPVVGTTVGWYYFFDGGSVENWPVHDPCALTTADNHLKGIHPQGQIWLR